MLSTRLCGAAAAAVAAGFTAQAHAQGSIYTQLGVGVNLTSSIETPAYSYDDGVDVFDGYLRAESDPRITGGIEIGADRIGGRMRFGVAYDYARASLDTVRIVGTLNGTAVDQTANINDLGLEGADLVTGAHFITGQAAVNVAPINAPVRALIGGGAGAGFADGVDMGLALSGTAALEFPMARGFSGGLRYRYIRASGWTDDALGFEYEPASLHLISLTVTVSDGGH